MSDQIVRGGLRWAGGGSSGCGERKLPDSCQLRLEVGNSGVGHP